MASIAKREKAVFVFCFAVAWAVYAFNDTNPDFGAYRTEYYNNSGMFTEPIFLFISDIFRSAGCSYRVFIGAVAFAGLLAVAGAIRSLSPYPNMVFFMYMIYPLCMDVVHVRSFLAQACMISAVTLIVKYHENKSTKTAALGALMLLLGVGFHYSAVMYLPLILLILPPQKFRTLLAFIIPICYLAFPLIIKLLFPLVSYIIGFNKANLWLGSLKWPTLMHFLRLAVARWLLLPVLILAKRCTDARGPHPDDDENKTAEDSTVSTQNEVLMLAFVYITLNFVFEMFLHTTYERISRPAVIVGSILLSRYIYGMNKENARLFWALGLVNVVIYFSSAMFFTKVVSQTWFTGIFRSVFENSYVWQALQ